MTTQTLKNQRLFCPNPGCEFHALPRLGKRLSSRARKFHRHGSYFSGSTGQKIFRYRCQICKKTFSQNASSIEYRFRKRGLSSQVYRLFCEGLCNRQIARLLQVAESTVRRRLKRLAQQSLLQHQRRTADLEITEPISYDGLENFAKSQFEPNNLNHAIGFKSLFIYDFNLAIMNRKGDMSDAQKLKKEELERRLRPYKKDSIQIATTAILPRVVSKCTGPCLLLSDKSYHYRNSVKRDLKFLPIEHHTISSKAARCYRHILFPVNHADLLARQQIKAFSRETISFSKTHGYMAQKYALFMSYKNFVRPQFTKKQVYNHLANTQTPAMAQGLTKKILRFRDFFATRLLPTQVELSEDWKYYYRGEVPDFRVPEIVTAA